MSETGPTKGTPRNLPRKPHERKRRMRDGGASTIMAEGGKRPAETTIAEIRKQVSQAYAARAGSGRLCDIADLVDYIDSINPGFSGRVAAALHTGRRYDEVCKLTLDDVYHHSVLENDSWKTERKPDPTDAVLKDCLAAMEDIAEKHNLTLSIMCAGMAEAIALSILECLETLGSSKGAAPIAEP